ncbi:MAG: RlmE family RNA methyltransferase [Proteobacteria bacterium]|nr:RlmE family RNA methyltransferase [Pseudomonadota bacterium]NBX86805.1 RlmE family RNA methyltransferase [Pseudomonadota bacterium]
MVKLAKIRKTSLSKSSQAWVRRQLADPYVAKAQAAGYRARAAFKLLEIDERFHILRGRTLVADLGCAPGSWAQITAAKGMLTVGIDLLPCDPLAKVTFIQDDFTTAQGLQKVLHALGGQQPNLVMADMAANTVGHKETDGLRTQALTELAVDFALNHLAKGGHFTTKIFMNGYENTVKKQLTPHFARVQLFKPKASRSESRETFLVALGRR